MDELLASAYAPPTLGSSLRAFTFGHVRLLDVLAARWLVNVAAIAPSASGIADHALVDINDTIKEGHDYRKQCSGYGYSGVRGSNALVKILSTATAAPVVIIGARLRKGSSGSLADREVHR